MANWSHEVDEISRDVGVSQPHVNLIAPVATLKPAFQPYPSAFVRCAVTMASNDSPIGESQLHRRQLINPVALAVVVLVQADFVVPGEQRVLSEFW